MQTKKKNKFVNKRSVLLTTHQKCFVKKVAICLKKTSNAMKPNEECLLTDIYPSAYINTSRNPMQVHVQLFYLYQCRCTGHSSHVVWSRLITSHRHLNNWSARNSKTLV